MTQLLAGMIAEPAFLSEYTIFALDPTKQPKSQSDNVVSPLSPYSAAFNRGRRIPVILEGKTSAACGLYSYEDLLTILLLTLH